MTINPKFKLRKVGGKSLIILQNSLNLEGILTLNDTGEFIWKMIEKGAETGDIVTSLAAECNVQADEIKEEVFEFIDNLKKAGIISE